MLSCVAAYAVFCGHIHHVFRENGGKLQLAHHGTSGQDRHRRALVVHSTPSTAHQLQPRTSVATVATRGAEAMAGWRLIEAPPLSEVGVCDDEQRRGCFQTRVLRVPFPATWDFERGAPRLSDAIAVARL